MKKLLYLFTLILMVSCSDDDGPSSTHLASKITTTSATPEFNNVIVLNYDQQNRLSSVIKSGNTPSTCFYHYNDLGQVSKLSIQIALDPVREINFEYDSANRITQYELDDVVTEIEFDAETNTYMLGGTSIILNDSGEFLSVFDNVYTYESKNGVFKNANTDFNFQLISILYEPLFLFFANKTAVVDLTNELTDTPMYSIENSFDAAGYITEAEVTGTSPGTQTFVATIEYTDL